MPTATPVLSEQARSRLARPPRRGMFEPVDAARRQLGLLSVTDDGGQLRTYWLVDLESKRIEDARFLSFGSLASHPIGDAFTELVRGITVGEACALPPERVEELLRDEADAPAFGAAGMEPLACIGDLQAKAAAELPTLKLLPKPVEVERYERKRQQDWDEHDRAWLPLSLLKKVAKVQKSLDLVLAERLERPDIGYSVEGLH
ncbi:MAG: iron-sulfur cluster assembly scaffold protein, partial [Planctomycetota bacterium]